MKDYKIGDIINVIVIGSQPYGLFVRPEDDENTTGLSHISEISYDFVKDVKKVADIGEKITAKVLDYDTSNSHLKLSIKALNDRARYKRNKDNLKIKVESKKLTDFSTLEKNLSMWINETLKRRNNND